MQARDIVIGEYYHHKAFPNGFWAKPIKILQPHTGINTSNCILVECEWSKCKDSVIGLIKHFKVSSLIKEKTNV